MDSGNFTLTGPIFFWGRRKYKFKKIHLNWPNIFWEGVSINSRTSTFNWPNLFWGRSKYGVMNFHLNWPNIFWEGVSMDSRISTLTGPIFFGKEEVWIEKLPPQLAQFF